MRGEVTMQGEVVTIRDMRAGKFLMQGLVTMRDVTVQGKVTGAWRGAADENCLEQAAEAS